MPDQDYDKDKVVALLNRIVEEELAGVVRYTHAEKARRHRDIRSTAEERLIRYDRASVFAEASRLEHVEIQYEK